jgi:TctA family transporter
MSWAVTLVAGFVGMFFGAVGIFGIALACVKWYRIVSFEGGSGYFVIGLSIFGVIGGFVFSIIAARVACCFVSPDWYSQFGGALAIVLAVLAIILAYSYRGIDRIPSIDGKSINSVWEIRLPVAGKDQYLPHG